MQDGTKTWQTSNEKEPTEIVTMFKSDKQFKTLIVTKTGI